MLQIDIRIKRLIFQSTGKDSLNMVMTYLLRLYNELTKKIWTLWSLKTNAYPDCFRWHIVVSNSVEKMLMRNHVFALIKYLFPCCFLHVFLSLSLLDSRILCRFLLVLRL